MKSNAIKVSTVLMLFISIIHSCTKDKNPVPTDLDLCAGKNIAVTAQITPTSGLVAADGSLLVTATGSTNFTYSINNGPFQDLAIFSGLVVGNYIITAKDANGCTGKGTFNITSANCPVITFNTSSNSTSGPAATDGKITVTAAAGGLAPYQYSIDGGVNYPGAGATYVFTNLAVGSNYKITVKDANGCIASSPFNITVDSQCGLNLSLSATSIDKCSNILGSLSASASGGSGNYEYSADGNQYSASNSFSSLPVGTYTIYAKDVTTGCVVNKPSNINLANAGSLFLGVKAILTANCIVCHHPGQINGQWGVSPDFTVDCNIVDNKIKIKNRAIDGNFQNQYMPPNTIKTITAAQEKAILDWINAGGKYTD